MHYYSSEMVLLLRSRIQQITQKTRISIQCSLGVTVSSANRIHKNANAPTDAFAPAEFDRPAWESNRDSSIYIRSNRVNLLRLCDYDLTIYMCIAFNYLIRFSVSRDQVSEQRIINLLNKEDDRNLLALPTLREEKALHSARHKALYSNPRNQCTWILENGIS